MRRQYQAKLTGQSERLPNNIHFVVTGVLLLLSFLLGCIVSGSIVLHLSIAKTTNSEQQQQHPHQSFSSDTSKLKDEKSLQKSPLSSTSTLKNAVKSPLEGVKILVVLASYDFSQIPHLEEVLDSYHDVAVSGAMAVDVVIHTTVPYPVVYIDMWNDRFNSPQFTITIKIKSKSLRLHLVDCHRQEFYTRIDDYDLFIYSEDDIRVTPTTVATYWIETLRIEQILLQQQQQQQPDQNYKPHDFNVGIIRYEYNYPANVIIDDNTRHATQNVTRVFWEHSSFQRPDIVPNAVYAVPQEPLSKDYVTLQNHHQGMYLATQSLLEAWKERCHFDVAVNRPGNAFQPSEGTQRVWMSSQMLYGKRHCNVQQVFPRQSFGTLTVWHLPNKNYRRVGKYHNRTFATGSEVFERPHPSLLRALELHLALKKAFSIPQQPPQQQSSSFGEYHGCIRMVDEVDDPHHKSSQLLQQRMKDYHAYIQRGGILCASDLIHTDLVAVEAS